MADWIKTDGTKQTVKPKARHFTNDELHDLVGGFLTGHTLTRDERGLFMFMDDDSIGSGKPVNRQATAVLHQHRPDLAHMEVYGDVVVTDLTETGDE